MTDLAEDGDGAEDGDNFSNNREAQMDRDSNDTYYGIKMKDVPQTFNWQEVKRDIAVRYTEALQGNLLYPFKYTALFSENLR